MVLTPRLRNNDHLLYYHHYSLFKNPHFTFSVIAQTILVNSNTKHSLGSEFLFIVLSKGKT